MEFEQWLLKYTETWKTHETVKQRPTVLSSIIRKNRSQLMAHIHEELLQASRCVVSLNAIDKDAHLLGSHGRVAAYKPLITKSYRSAWLRGCKMRRQ